MMHPTTRTLTLSGGTVTLRALGAHVLDAYTIDLITIGMTFRLVREHAGELTRDALEPGVWGAFWRVIHASLDGTPLPERLTWGDRMRLLEGVWDLNDLEVADPKLEALTTKAARKVEATLTRQGLTTPGMNG